MKRKVRSAEPAHESGRPFSATDPGFVIETHRAFILLACLCILLKSLIFAPISFWPLAFVCLVPWLILIGGARQAPRVYFYSFMLGLAFFLINMRWLVPVTVLGYVTLSAYQAAYFPLIACAVRHVVRRRRWSLAIVLPFVWVGSEFLRAVVLSGFPWFFLSHSVYRVLSLIQISDVVGAYGVSFVVAAVNGAVADAIIARLSARRGATMGLPPGRVRRSVAWAAVLLVGACIYGQVQLRRGVASEGPKVAIIQGDFLSTIFDEEFDDEQKKDVYFDMMNAAAKEDPDLYLLPETPWIMYLNPEARDFHTFWRDSFEAFRDFADRQQAHVVTGSASLIRTPNDLRANERRYNSATIFRPDGSEPGRYDKVHLVYFGEVVPFRFGRLRPLYFWLNSLVPFSGPEGTTEYSLFPGEEFAVFTMEPKSQPNHVYRFGVPICYEDVMPYVSRRFVSSGHANKRVDFLLNISNDGWFGRGVQQPQHLAIGAFRAVENRVGIARAVNTGVSGFIEPSGRVYELVSGDPAKRWPGECGFRVANVKVDSRYTFYSRYGDWFAWCCAVLWLIFFVDYWIVRVRTYGLD